VRDYGGDYGDYGDSALNYADRPRLYHPDQGSLVEWSD